MATNSAAIVTVGGKERVEATSKLYSLTYKEDPVITYMLPGFTDSERHDYLYSYFVKLLTAAGLNAGIFEEVENFSSASVIMPPGKKMDNLLTLIPAGLPSLLFTAGLRSCYRMMGEVGGKTDAAKRKGLRGAKEYWYLFLIRTSPQCQGRGLGAVCIKSL